MLKDQERKRSRRFRRKEKKKFIQEVKKVTEAKPIFDKNIPLIDQIKSELGEEEFNKICQHKQQIEEFDAPRPKVENNFNIKREKNRNKNAILEVDFNANQKENEEFEEFSGSKAPSEEDKLRKLFPKAEKISDMYETFDEYEENLEIIDLIEKNRDGQEELQEENEKQEDPPVKYKELEENIVIHEYE